MAEDTAVGVAVGKSARRQLEGRMLWRERGKVGERGRRTYLDCRLLLLPLRCCCEGGSKLQEQD